MERRRSTIAGARLAALLVLPDTLFIDLRGRLAEIATARKLPAIYSNRLHVADGGLMCYGSNPIDAFREAGITPAVFCEARSSPTCRWCRRSDSSW